MNARTAVIILVMIILVGILTRRQPNERFISRRRNVKSVAEKARIEHLVPEVNHLGPLQLASLRLERDKWQHKAL